MSDRAQFMKNLRDRLSEAERLQDSQAFVAALFVFDCLHPEKVEEKPAETSSAEAPALDSSIVKARGYTDTDVVYLCLQDGDSKIERHLKDERAIVDSTLTHYQKLTTTGWPNALR